MSKRKLLFVMGIFILLINIVIIRCLKFSNDNYINLSVDVKSDTAGVYQLYYSDDGFFDEINSKTLTYSNIMDKETLVFDLPANIRYIRLDLPEALSIVCIQNLRFEYQKETLPINMVLMVDFEKSNSIAKINHSITELIVKTVAFDPHIVFNVTDLELQKHIDQENFNKNLFYKIIYCCILNVTFIGLSLTYIKIQNFTKELIQNRKIIFRLAKNDFKTKYVGSYLGIVWAFVQPIVTISVYWFVFEIGFRSQKIENVPYVLWLSAGLVPWFYFSEAWLGGTNSLIEYSYLVKKVVFKIGILPIVKITSALFVHIFFIGFVVLLFMANGIAPDIYTLQIIYYVICMIVLVLGLSYLTSAFIVFFRDISQIMSILLQVGMWITPILWNSNMLDEKYHWILKLNPMYYIVQGYRYSLIDKVWFWQSYNWTLYFWCLVTGLFIMGISIFRRLKPHYADVL